MAERSKWTSLPIRHTDGHQAHDMFSITNYERNANQKYNEVGTSLVAQWLRICLLMQGT